MLNPLYSCLQHSQMFTKFASMQSLPTTLSKWQELSQMFTKLNCTYCLPSTLILHVFCLERSQMFTKLNCTYCKQLQYVQFNFVNVCTSKHSQTFTKFASMQSLPTTVSKWEIHAQLSKKHSKMFTKLNCTCPVR